MHFKLSRYVLIFDPLYQKDDIRTERIVYSTRTGKRIKISNYAVSLISNREFLEIPDRLFTILMYHEIIVPEGTCSTSQRKHFYRCSSPGQ